MMTVLRTLLLSALLIGIFSSSVQAASIDAQYQVRAQFIYNFVNYVEWPQEAFDSASSPIRICLFGAVPFSAYILSYSGSLVGSRELTFIVTTSVEDIHSGCHILYVGDDQRVALPDLWKQIKYIYVLSVGEREGFVDNGGIINILRTTDRLNFEVNITNALGNGLFLDSDLLALARTIKRNTTIAPTQ